MPPVCHICLFIEVGIKILQVFFILPFADGNGREVNLCKGFHHFFYAPTIHSLLSQIKGLFLGNQGQEPEHSPSHNAVRKLPALYAPTI